LAKTFIPPILAWQPQETLKAESDQLDFELSSDSV